MESFGIKLPDEAYQRMEESVSRPTTPYVTAASQVVFVPIIALIIAGIAMGIFTAVLGGDATFKQVFSVVAHAGRRQRRRSSCSSTRSTTRAGRCRARPTSACFCPFSTKTRSQPGCSGRSISS